MSDALHIVMPPGGLALGTLDGGAVNGALYDIVGRAEDSFDALFDVVAGAVFDAFPDYCVGRSADVVHDIRAGIRRAAAVCLSLVADGRSLDDDERRALRRTGAQWARHGIAKSSVADGVKVATRASLAFLMTCARPGTDAEALTEALCEVARLVAAFEDEAVANLAAGYDEARVGLLSRGDRGEALLVDRLLERRFLDVEEVSTHAAHVGLRRSRPAYVVVATTVDGVADPGRLRAAAAALRPRVLLSVGPVRSDGHVHLPLVVQPASPRAWKAVLDDLESVASAHELTFVYSDAPADLTAVAETYRPMQESLGFLVAVTRCPGAVRSLLLRFQRVVCAGGEAERRALVREVFEPLDALPERERAELFAALDSLYETGGSAATLAKHLHLHKNTVSNRLRRVGSLTGLDLRRPAERLVVEALLRIRHVVGAPA